MSAAAQAYLSTRVAIMAARLFDAETVSQLAGMQLPELAERFGLGALLDERQGAPAGVQGGKAQSPRSASRAVEQALIRTLFAELLLLARPMAAAQRAVVLAWGRKYALFNLKTLLRGKLYDLDPQEIRDNLFDLPASVRLPDGDLFRAESAPELLRQLEAGPFSTIARQAREIYEQRRDPFALEAAIDQRCYASLLHQVAQLQGGDFEPLRQLVGADLDRIGLLWLLRFRFSYQLSPSETFFQLVPSPRLLHRSRLLALVNIDTFEGVLQALPPPLSALLADSRSVLDVQRVMGRWLAREARRVLRHGASGVAHALAYLMLRERDLMLLFAVVQGRLLGLSSEVVEVALEMTDPTCPWSGAARAATAA